MTTAAASRLAELVDPATTAVITMELQRGVCGDLAAMRALADAVTASGMLASTARALEAARGRGVPVVHCTFSLLPDRAGTPMNSPLMRVLSRDPDHLPHGSDATAVLAEIGRAPTDLESNRHHGFSPFTGTDLDSLLRERGVTTVIVTGVSLNLGIPGAVIEAIALGYRVVVLRDCVIGVPEDYGNAVIDLTLKILCTIATTDELVAAWS